MRIWERGVGETMASGTGATAAAFAASMYRRVVAPVDVSLPGGTLTIELVDDQAWMVGPGETVYSGRID
jgi:diaminopimelate epimerase